MKSGIYQIKNTLNNKVYVGSAKDFEKRWKRHFKDLEKGCHSSIKLQRSFNKHGNVFECSILEEIPYEKDLIIERENFWIKELNSKINGYNIADATFGDTCSTHPLKEEIIKNVLKLLKLRCLNLDLMVGKLFTVNPEVKTGVGIQKPISFVSAVFAYKLLLILVVNAEIVQVKIIHSLIISIQT